MNKIALLVNEDSDFGKTREMVEKSFSDDTEIYVFNDKNLNEMIFTIQDLKDLGYKIVAFI